jgi:prepilin-type N-terminal cleavage/methylation domain-containing protein
MKDKLPGQIRNQRGFSTIEMLIAVAIISLTLTAVVVAIDGTQMVTADSQTNTEALHKAQEILDQALETSRNNYGAVGANASTYVNGITYNTSLQIPSAYASQCQEQVISQVRWTASNNRAQSVSLTSTLTNVPLMLALSGGCSNSLPTGGWNPPSTWSSGNFSPGKPQALDELNKLVYIGYDKTPFLQIADTSTSSWNQGSSSGNFITFTNHFNDGVQINDIKVVKYSSGTTYAFVARDTTSNQFEVINVNTPATPVSAAQRSLSGTTASGWRLYYFDQKIFMLAQSGSGPELHIFDVSNPTTPTEIGTGTNIGRTANNLTVTKQLVAGIWHYYMFLATDKTTAPLSIFNITFPTPSSATVTEMTSAEPTFAAYQRGQCVFLLGSLLYFGRNNDAPRSDLFVYDVSNIASNSVVLKASANVSSDVLGISVSGSFVFMATNQSNSEFKVWHSDPNNFTAINTNFNFPNGIDFNNGIKYDNNFVYVASQANDALRILYSP